MKIESRARTALDSRLESLRPVSRFDPPAKGWIRAIRDAMGMTGVQLARRMGISPPSLVDAEKSERAAKIRLDTLQRAADALDCTLVYALVPRKGLKAAVDERSREIAREQLSRVSHSMAMEDQAVTGDDVEARVRDFINNSLRERDLWNKE